MSITGLHVFDQEVDQANEWLRELMDETNGDDRPRAFASLRSALHALRDRLGRDEAVRFGNALPTLLRGFYYEDWKPSKEPRKDGLPKDEESRAVFRVLESKGLWPEPLRP